MASPTDTATTEHQSGSDIGAAAENLKERVSTLADRASEVAGQVREQAAEGLERVSSAIRERSVGELLDDLNDFARRQPAAFFGGAVLAGFVLSRFLKSSAETGDTPGATGPNKPK